MSTPTLINAAEMQREHPETFERPSDIELSAVKAGHLAKVCCCGERFWVRVTGRRGDVLRGRVANLLLFAPLQYGERIKFHADNVFSIYEVPR